MTQETILAARELAAKLHEECWGENAKAKGMREGNWDQSQFVRIIDEFLSKRQKITPAREEAEALVKRPNPAEDRRRPHHEQRSYEDREAFNMRVHGLSEDDV